MDTGGFPAARGGDRKGKRAGRRARGPRIVERDGYWHLYGTIRIGRQSIRLRRSLGLAVRDCTQDEAELAAETAVAEIKAQAGGQIRRGDPVAVAALAYLSLPRARPLGPSSIVIVKEVVARFRERRLNEIAPREWIVWIDGEAGKPGRMSGRAAATRERFLGGVLALLNFAQAHHGLTAVPKPPRDQAARNPNRRARRRVQELRPELIWMLLINAHIALRAQLAVEKTTGARVSSVLYGCCLADLNLTAGRESITFRDTKNGRDVTAALDHSAVAILKDYLRWRGPFVAKDAPLFVTPAGKPYAFRRGGGGQNKSGFNGAKRRAQAGIRGRGAALPRRCRRAGDRKGAWAAIAAARDDAALLGRVTQHWFRHRLATLLLRQDPRAAMEQGGWLDIRSVMGYALDVPEHRHKLVTAMDDLDTFLDTPTMRTRESKAPAKP
jgi:integrase